MTVKVAFFAAARDIAGCDSLEIDVDDATTVGQLKTMIAERFPEMDSIISSSTWAVDHEYVGNDQQLHQGAEVGLIPPVSGG